VGGEGIFVTPFCCCFPFACSFAFCLFSYLFCFFLQVATALLVAGSTLTFWIPWQTPFASTSSYSSVVQSASLPDNCRRLTHGSFQLMHMSGDDHAVELIESWRTTQRQSIITALTTLPEG